jgi:hypothetical protein
LIACGEDNLRGHLVQVRIEKASPWALQGVTARQSGTDERRHR